MGLASPVAQPKLLTAVGSVLAAHLIARLVTVPPRLAVTPA